MQPVFCYTGRTGDGLFVRGTIDAADEAGAVAQLRTRALYVTAIARAESPGAILIRQIPARRLSRTSLVSFARSFATLISAGVAIRRALSVEIALTTDHGIKNALTAVAADVETGMPLSSALTRHPNIFSALFIAMVRSGEAGGTLDEVLATLAQSLEDDLALRKRLWVALTYPAIVALSAALLVVFLFTSVVPMFAGLYEQMHVQLPALTLALMNAGNALRSPRLWAMMVALCAVAAVMLLRLRSVPGMALFVDSHLLRLPIIGGIARKTATARFGRTVGSLLHSGTPLDAALKVAADVVGNRAYGRVIEDVRASLLTGDSFSGKLAQTALFDALATQLVAAGEEAGRLDVMLLRVAAYNERDVAAAIAALGSTLEPLILALLGAGVGFIVISVFIPLYSLIGNIK